jgi:hypothetical protein
MRVLNSPGKSQKTHAGSQSCNFEGLDVRGMTGSGHPHLRTMNQLLANIESLMVVYQLTTSLAKQ